MNGKPHTHQVELGRRYHYADSGTWIVKYGDSRAFVSLGFITPRPWMVKRATKRVIAHHDRGSLRAARRAEKAQEIQALAVQVRSDWWMDSQERMDQLYDKALHTNRIYDAEQANERARNERRARIAEREKQAALR